MRIESNPRSRWETKPQCPVMELHSRVGRTEQGTSRTHSPECELGELGGARAALPQHRPSMRSTKSRFRLW